jgi:hypothetical protein
MNEGFHFHTQYSLVELLGINVKNPQELLDGMKNVPISSIYYHTHKFLQQHHYLSPLPPNDFASWLKDILHMERLGEAFLGVDTISFKNLEDLRSEFVRILEEHLSRDDGRYECPRGYEFYFMACQTFVLPTPYVAHNLKEFAEILNKISIQSLYFHIFEARMRLGVEENDFSAWFKGLGEEELAAEISKLDPYNTNLDNMRTKIIRMVMSRAKDR